MVLEDEPATENQDSGNPKVREIFSEHVPTLAFIPKRAVKEVGAALAHACNLAEGGDWLPLSAFAKTVLWAPPKDSMGTTPLYLEVQRRAKKFVLEGWGECWDDIPTFPLRGKDAPEASEVGSRKWREMVLRKAKVSSLSSTYKMLTSEGVAGCTPEVVEILKGLHPPRGEEIPPPSGGVGMRRGEPAGSENAGEDRQGGAGALSARKKQEAQAFKLTKEEVASAIRSFPKGTAPGPDVFRPQYLKDLLRFQHEEDPYLVSQALTGPVARMLAGRVPKDFAPHWAGARLIPLLKKDGGIRPVAVGCCLRRLASKVAASQVAEKAANLLMPHQVGVAVRGGGSLWWRPSTPP